MGTKKVIVTVYGENHIDYATDIVVEAPQGMADEDICEIIVNNVDRFPEPKWREIDEVGFSINYDSSDSNDVTFSDEEPSVRLTEDKDGHIRIFTRKKHDR